MTVRLAGHEDLRSILPLGEEFFRQFPQVAAGEFSPEHCLALWGQMLTDGTGFIVMADDASAALAVAIYPDPFSGEMTASGIFWIARGMNGGGIALSILEAAERECAEFGAKQFVMASLGGRPSPAILYERRGYRLSHVSYVKDI